MAKPRKKPTAQPAAAEPPPVPQVGDKVTIPSAKSVLEVTHVLNDFVLQRRDAQRTLLSVSLRYIDSS